ncbi:MAG: DNA glycosylase [Candidatus Micrarchaeota archaeon]
MIVKTPNFELRDTVEGGQIFNYEKADGWYFIIHSRSVIKIRQTGDGLEVFTFPNKNNARLARDLLNFYADYLPAVKKYFSDKRILRSYEKYSGVKICQLDPWECTIGFICSQMNNMPRIRKMVRLLSQNLGDEVEYDGRKFHLFPTPKQLADAEPEILAKCGLGYREYYLVQAAKAVSRGYDFGKLREFDYVHAKKALLMLPGIGEKVADCILLFSLGFTEAFPVDVWIKRIMEKLYFKGKVTPEKKIANFARKKFGKDAAIVHEFLFANRAAFA